MNTPALSVVLPALNEEATIGKCITKIRTVFADLGIDGEIIIADSSEDRTAAIARDLGARVVRPEKRGYGNTYLAGLARARGRYIVIGDADDTYDFLEIPKLLALLDAGVDMAPCSRLRGRSCRRDGVCKRDDHRGGEGQSPDRRSPDHLPRPGRPLEPAELLRRVVARPVHASLPRCTCGYRPPAAADVLFDNTAARTVKEPANIPSIDPMRATVSCTGTTASQISLEMGRLTAFPRSCNIHNKISPGCARRSRMSSLFAGILNTRS